MCALSLIKERKEVQFLYVLAFGNLDPKFSITMPGRQAEMDRGPTLPGTLV
jgi:hypothetical protein